MDKEDKKFMVIFSSIVGVMAVLAVILIVLASIIDNVIEPTENTVARERTVERISPVGEVLAGDTGRAALAERAAAVAETMVAAFDGSLDGSMIYQRVCAACHDGGIAGSPTMELSVWEEQGRMSRGLDLLVQHAIEGYQGDYGYMPPRGGRSDLTDEQVRVTVEYMLDALQ